MAHIFNKENLKYTVKQSPISEYAWHTSQKLFEITESKHLQFDVRLLDPGKYSYPYHFHRNAEEIFIVLSGKSMLRTPDKYIEVNQGDIIFFEMGPEGAHQLYNHTESQCKYLDIRTDLGLDICEYPDSGKVNILPYKEVYEKKNRVDYYKGEESIKDKWTQGQKDR